MVRAGDKPAEGAYVQIRSLGGDFQAEVKTDAEGRFVLHPVDGRWRLVSWAPGGSRAEKEIEVAGADLKAELTLS
jgi:hypothetical protein